MTWEEMKANLEFALKRAKEAVNDEDKAYFLGFYNGIEVIAYTIYPKQYREYIECTGNALPGLNEPIS